MDQYASKIGIPLDYNDKAFIRSNYGQWTVENTKKYFTEKKIPQLLDNIYRQLLQKSPSFYDVERWVSRILSGETSIQDLRAEIEDGPERKKHLRIAARLTELTQYTRYSQQKYKVFDNSFALRPVMVFGSLDDTDSSYCIRQYTKYLYELGAIVGYKVTECNYLPDELTDDDLLILSLQRPLDSCDLVLVEIDVNNAPKIIAESRRKYPLAKIIGVLCWDTDSLPDPILEILYSCNSIVTPSEYQTLICDICLGKNVYTIPISFNVDEKSPTQEPTAQGEPTVQGEPTSQGEPTVQSPSEYTFYSTGNWDARDGLNLLIDSYLQAFLGRKDVKLIVNVKTDETTVKESCQRHVEAVSSLYIDSPKIEMNYGDSRRTGDCYVFVGGTVSVNVDACIATSKGKLVIITGQGAHSEYLKGSLTVNSFPQPVDMCETSNLDHGNCQINQSCKHYPLYTSNQNWQTCMYEDVKRTLKFAYEERVSENNIGRAYLKKGHNGRDGARDIFNIILVQ